MCNIEQCNRCRLNLDTCGHYDHVDPSPCVGYVKPLDNSKMFSRWYKFSGRIGRLEYVLTMIAALIIFFYMFFIAGMIMGATGWEPTTKTDEYLLMIGCMLPSIFIAIAAGVKRTNDTRVSRWYALTPLIPLFYINVITIVLFGAGCVFLFKDEGEDGVNEHGSNPVQPYAEQLKFEY